MKNNTVLHFTLKHPLHEFVIKNVIITLISYHDFSVILINHVALVVPEHKFQNSYYCAFKNVLHQTRISS